jgi:hypothetical protein
MVIAELLGFDRAHWHKCMEMVGADDELRGLPQR